MREFLGAAVVQVKPLSGKMSWTTHETKEKADNQADRNHRYNTLECGRNPMKGARFCYRVNVYSKRDVRQVVRWEIRVDPLLGQVLVVTLKPMAGAMVSQNLFRRIAQAKREVGDYGEFCPKDGVRVGRYLLDKFVIIKDGEVTEVIES
jgi:hypothetical protein